MVDIGLHGIGGATLGVRKQKCQDSDLIVQQIKLLGDLKVQDSVSGLSGAALGVVKHWDKFSDTQKRRYSIAIAEASDLVMNLLNDIFDYVKLSSIKRVRCCTPVDLSQILQERSDVCRELNEAKNSQVRLNVYIQPNLNVLCDRYYAVQLVDRMISQTDRYHKLQNLNITLEKVVMQPSSGGISGARCKSAALLNVECQGANLSVIEQARLLEILSTFSSRIQLRSIWEVSFALCGKIVELYRGKIWMESNPSHSTVKSCVLLPMG